jgi:small subunit ribosomal protein S20
MAEEKKAKVKRPTALKRDMQSLKRQLDNRILKARIRTAANKLEKEGSAENYRSLQALLDKSTKKGFFKLNKVSRLKAKFAAKNPS